MFFHQRFIPGLAIYSYMVGDEKSKTCAVIDPTRDVDYFVQLAKAEGLRIEHVLETHVHADFISGAKELKARLNGEPAIHCSGMGGAEWTPPYADFVVKDGDSVRMGAIRLQALHTPGHTPEHITWVLFDESRSATTPWLLLSGDFVFVGDVGRPDLLGEAARKELAHQLYQSVFNRLPPFEDFTEIFPGHGAGSLCGKAIGSRSASTLGYERRFNVSLQASPEDVWVTNLLSGMPIAPPYFRRMKQVNAKGPAVIGSDMPDQKRFVAKDVHEQVCENCIVLDVRSKEAFAASHIPKAINIPLGAVLPTWAGWVLPYDVPMLIVADNRGDAERVVTHLLRVGFDDVRGYMEDGMDAWENAGYPIETLGTMSVHELQQKLKSKTPPFVLDVRSEQEWASGHIEGAKHIHGGLLQTNFKEVPKDRPIAVICGSGYRASIAASFLKREGYTDVSNVLGGMSAYMASGGPTMK